jgi:hypothetical protein
VPPGEELALRDQVTTTILGTVEYTNDAAILVEGDGCRLLKKTDGKLRL